MTSEEIIQICNRLKEDKQYYADKKYLEKVSRRNLEHLKNSNLYWDCKKMFYDSLYIRFSNKTIQTQYKTYKPTLSNMLDIFTNIIFMDGKNTFFNPNNTHLIIYNYDKYRTKNISINNLKLIFKYYDKDIYFRNVCNKYKILDHNYINKYKQNLITYEEYINHNIIIDLFYYLLPNPVDIAFTKNQLSTIIALNALILTYKRYNPFRILYLLHLLERRPVHYYNDSNIPLDKRLKPGFTRQTHNPSGFFIPKYTDELFTSFVLPTAKIIYDMDLSKITYTIVARNFGFDTADSVYRNISSRLKYKAKKDFITIDDTINILLTSTTLKEKLHLYGFITTNNIRYELQLLNQERKEKLQPFIEVKDTDTKFITGIVRNVTDIKEALNKINVEYVRLNPKTIDKIKKHQIQNGIEQPTPLTLNQTRIVLKDLIVKSAKKKQTK